MKLYAYVGPEEVARHWTTRATGTPIASMADLERWLGDARGPVVATFTISVDGVLWIADRHSEHVGCAGGKAVLSAGEMTFERDGEWMVSAVSNQSTGYCPGPASWAAVAKTLHGIGVSHPSRFTSSFEFTHCRSCGQCHIVKPEYDRCSVCGAEL